MARTEALGRAEPIGLTQRVLGGPPARTLADAVRIADPFTPLDPAVDGSVWVDLSPSRGGEQVASIRRAIMRSGGVPTLHLVTGQTDSGKTSELLRLRKELAATGHCSVFLLDAVHLLDARDIDLEDVLVAM
jgi:hypothetical protein